LPFFFCTLLLFDRMGTTTSGLLFRWSSPHGVMFQRLEEEGWSSCQGDGGFWNVKWQSILSELMGGRGVRQLARLLKHEPSFQQ
jgi:hypothetical protein